MNNTENWIDVCRFNELIINDGVCSLVGEQQIAIFRTNQLDEVYAIGNYDPIGKANVLSRGIVGDIHGEPVVASPLYKQHFSLLSGQCLEDDQVSVPSYPTQVIDGVVQILVKA
jgi:nitrite reductase (NADH) small subunit